MYVFSAAELIISWADGHGFFLGRWQTYIVLFGLGCTIFFQIRWLNSGLKRYFFMIYL